MSDTRAAIRELRSLGEKRSTQGLTEQEQSRLAELRERLGLPSEPAESRSGGPRSGGASSTAPVAAPPPAGATPVGPTLSGALPAFGAPLEPAALPSFAAASPPEPVAPPVADTLPALEAAVLGAMVQAGPPPSGAPSPRDAVPPPEAPPDLAPELLAPVTDAAAMDAGPPLEALPDLAPESLAPVTDAAGMDAGPPLEALPDLAPESLAPAPDLADIDAELPLEALPELAPESLAPAPDVAGIDAGPPPETLPELAPESLAQVTDVAGMDAAPETLPAEDPAAAWGATQVAAPADVEPAAPLRTSLAERIDAAVEGLETASPQETTEEPGWGAVSLATEAPAEEGAETFIPADLGAIPLDLADPAVDSSYPGGGGAIIELSSADVVLLEGETAAEPELGGEPEDPVPLAALHEFVGEQPADPRALEFDDQDEQPTLAPEDLQASGAELAAAPDAFHPASPPPELEVPPPPAPAARRISVPPPPPAPPPARPAPIPLTREMAPAPAPARRTATPPVPPAPPRAPASPPPPPGAFGDSPARVPTLSAARPEPPRRAGFGQSGPFARPPAVLMAPASLDVMDEEPGEPGEPVLPPEPPAADVATGAEVFGGAYLNPTFVEGEHRVVLHTLEGQVRRGTVKDLDLLDAVIRLAQPGRPPEAIAAERVKAIFFMQEPGAAPLPSAGRRIRVGFSDGRQIVGFSDDVDTGEQGFFLVPADTRTHTARIYVFRAGVQSISAA